MAFYDNYLDESHTMLRDACRRFAEKHIAPYVDAWEEAGEFPRELYGQAAQAGLLGVGFDEAIGGAGGDAMHSVMWIEGLMRGGSTGVSVGLGSLAIALPPIVLSESADLIDPVTGLPLAACADATCTARSGSDRHDFGIEGLLSYEPSPGTVFFFGYTRRMQDSARFDFRDVQATADGLFLKLSYRFRM